MVSFVQIHLHYMSSYQNQSKKNFKSMKITIEYYFLTFNQGNLADALVKRGHALFPSVLFFFKLTLISRSLIL